MSVTFLGPSYDPILLSADKPVSWVGLDVRRKPEEKKCLLSSDWARVEKPWVGVIKEHMNLCSDNLSGFIWRAKNHGSGLLALGPSLVSSQGCEQG